MGESISIMALLWAIFAVFIPFIRNPKLVLNIEIVREWNHNQLMRDDSGSIVFKYRLKNKRPFPFKGEISSSITLFDFEGHKLKDFHSGIIKKDISPYETYEQHVALKGQNKDDPYGLKGLPPEYKNWQKMVFTLSYWFINNHGKQKITGRNEGAHP